MRELSRSMFTVVQTAGSYMFRRAVRNIESKAPEELDCFHFAELKRQLRQAIKKITHYQKVFEYQEALNARNLNEFLTRLPIIEKNNLTNSVESFFPRTWGRGRLRATTSGTSGSPLRIYSSIRERLWGEALLCSQLERRTGFWGLRNAILLSGFYVDDSLTDENFYIRDSINNNTYISIYHLSPENAHRYALLLDTLRPKMVYGYASALNSFASLLSEIGYHPRDINLVVSTSEVLLPSWRKNIEAAMKSQVHNLYGSQEGCHFAFECARGHMHINGARGIVEVLNSNGVSRVGEGQAVITPIRRPSFPLFRYNLKDRISISLPNSRCACGLWTYEIGEVQGRSDDLVRTNDGRMISLLGYHLTKDLKGIRESQLVQKSLDYFVFSFVLDNYGRQHRAELESSIIAELVKRTRTVVSVSFEEVEQIPRDARGKFRAVVVDMK